MPSDPSRRRVLRACSLALAAGFAGCGAAPDDGGNSTDRRPDPARTATDTPSPTASPSGTDRTPYSGTATPADPCLNGRKASGLPYSVPDEPRTYQPSTLVVENDGADGASVAVAVAHAGEEFFRCRYDVAPAQSVTVPGITATAGTYDVTVETAAGERTERALTIPSNDNWPRIAVRIGEDGRVRVGCGGPAVTRATVENGTEDRIEVGLSLRLDGERVDAETLVIDAGGTRDVELRGPIGGVYTFAAGSSEGRIETELTLCYCYRARRPKVTFGYGDPLVESDFVVCQ